MPDFIKMLEPLVRRLTDRMDRIERATVTGTYCRVVGLSPLTVDLPGDPAAEAQPIPDMTYTVATTDSFNAVGFKVGTGGKYIIWQL